MKKKVIKPNIEQGGKAVPLGNNYYYMKGRKHSAGGIDVGKDLEVEDGEIMHLTPKEVKVFSSVPFLNGESPAQKVLGGENPNQVFQEQENFKDMNRIKDDGTKYLRGGKKRKALGGDDRLKRRTNIQPKTPITRISRKTEEDTRLENRTNIQPGNTNTKKWKEELITKPTSEISPITNRPIELNISGKQKLVYKPNTSKAIRSVSGTNNAPSTGKVERTSPVSIQPSLSSSPLTGVQGDTDLTINDNTREVTPIRGQINISGRARNAGNRLLNSIEDNPNIMADAIGAGSNIIGAIMSRNANRSMLNKLKYNKAPTARQAAKLKTRININPQLDKMRETLATYERDVDANTASSRTALARKQRGRVANMAQTNEIYGAKENAETQLINQDKLNQQQVADRNITEYNQWAERKAAFDNAVREKRSENDVAFIETLNSGVQDLIARGELRKKEDIDHLLMAISNPNAVEVMRNSGIKMPRALRKKGVTTKKK